MIGLGLQLGTAFCGCCCIERDRCAACGRCTECDRCSRQDRAEIERERQRDNHIEAAEEYAS